MPASCESTKWIVLTMTSEGIISALARVTEESTGFGSADLIGKPVTRILADASVFELEGILKSVREDGYWEGRLFHRDSEGKVSQAEGMLSGDRREGVGSCFLASVSGPYPASTAVTDESMLRVGAKLRSLAHEMNNPLAVIMGFAQLVMLDPRCEGRLKINLDKMYSEILRVTEVLEKLQIYAHSLQKNPPQRLGTTT